MIFLPLFNLPNILNVSLCSSSAYSIDKSFVYVSLKSIEGSETLLKS